MSEYYTEQISADVCIGNTLDTFNSNFGSLDQQVYNLSNRVNPNIDQIITAWGSYDGASTFSKIDGFNVAATVNHSGTGIYEVSFTSPLTTSNYIVHVTGETTSKTDALLGKTGYVHSKSVSGFTIEWGDHVGLADVEILNFSVIGGN